MTLYEDLKAAAAANPDKEFIKTRDGSMTYRQVFDEADKLSTRISHLQHDPIRPCTIRTTNDSAALCVIACMSIGKPFVLINPSAPLGRQQFYRRDSGADVELSDDWESNPALERRYCRNYEVRALTVPAEPWGTATDPTTVAALIYTSGSTGMPKAVVCTESAMNFVAHVIASELGYLQSDVVLSSLPMFFDFGLYQLFLCGLTGATLYFASGLETSMGLSETLAVTNATILPLVPPSAEKLAAMAQRGLASRSVRMITTTGGALDRVTRSDFSEAWPDVQVRAMYGLTECKRVAIMPADEVLDNLDACGRPLPQTTVSIRSFDNANRELGEMTIGEICVQGPHVMAGYHNNPDLTAARFQSTEQGIVLRSGDRGYIDAHGFLHCLGRDDDQIKVNGYRVSTFEIVAAAKQIQGVESAAVALSKEGKRLTLFYVGDATQSAVRSELKLSLEPHAIPTKIVTLRELPLSPNGKIDIDALERAPSNG